MKKKSIFLFLIALLCVQVLFADITADFFIAAEQGDLEKVKACIAAGADVNAAYTMSGLIFLYPPVGEWTALMTAAYLDNRELAELLLQAGADIDSRNEYEETALYWGVNGGSLGTVDLLIDAGADIELASSAGDTPLYEAARSGFTDIAELLINAGADYKKKNGGGYSPLWVAARNGSWRITRLLVEQGCTPTAKIFLVASEEHFAAPVLRELITGGVDITEPVGTAALENLIPKGSAEAFRLLLEAGAQPTWPMLETACRAGRTPIVRLLMDKVTPPEVSFNTRTRAAFYGQTKDLKALLVEGADIEKADRNGRTPLTAACYAGRVHAVELLCGAGAEVDRILHPRNSLKQTALQIAAAGNDVEICRILLQAGANPNGPAKEGSFQAPLPPLHAAAREGNLMAVKLLLDAGADPDFRHGYSDTPLSQAVKSNSGEIVQALLEAGADPLDSVSFGSNLLHQAAIWESMDVIEPLVNAGLDVNGKNTRGETAMDLIKAKGFREFEEKLTSLGAVK